MNLMSYLKLVPSLNMVNQYYTLGSISVFALSQIIDTTILVQVLLVPQASCEIFNQN